MELTMVNGLNTVGFATLDECEILSVSGGAFLDGLVHAIEGVALAGSGVAGWAALTEVTTTKVIPALLMVGGAAGATLAVGCGVVVAAYGIYEMCN